MLTIKNQTARLHVFLLAAALVFAGCMPKGPKALLDGKELLEAGRYAEAVEKLELATSLIATNAAAWNNLGLAYHHTGRAADAERVYLRALNLDRNLAEAHYNLGVLHLDEQKLDAAKAALTAYTALRANSSEGWSRLATVQLRRRELAEAEKSFGEALRLNAKSAEALNGLGLIQLQRRNPRGAAEYFNRALSEQPDYPAALLNLAIVNHAYLDNRTVALQKYREYLALPNRPSDWNEVEAVANDLARELSPPPVAATPVEAPMPPPPTLAPVVATRTETPAPRETTSAPVEPARTTSRPPAASSRPAERQMARASEPPANRPAPAPASARENQQAAVEDQPEKPRNGFLQRINPANLFRNSDEESAPRVAGGYPRYKYRRPAKPESGDRAAAEPVFNRALRQQQSHEFAAAIETYIQAVTLDPAYFEAYYNLAVAALTEGKLSQALTAYEMALAVQPDSMSARYNFALALKQGNYVQDAARELDRVLKRFPNEARAHIALGNIYAQQLKQPAKAKEHYTRALELDPRNPQATAIRFWLTSH